MPFVWEYEIGDVVDNLKIINRKVKNEEVSFHRAKSGKTIRTQKYYQYICLKCGFNCASEYYKNGVLLKDYWVKEQVLKNGCRCSCCHGTVVQTGINDIATTHPEVSEHFVDKELTYKYSAGVAKKVYVKCPICGFVNPEKVKINNLIGQGKKCIKCGDAISYPEKVMFSLLTQLNLKFDMNKSFEWSRGIKNQWDNTTGNKRYDFYLINENLIIEMNGIQHYEETPFVYIHSSRCRTFEEEKLNDKLKYDLAISNGCNYITIDCRQSNFLYIKTNIILSNLGKYINLDDVDWEKCQFDSLSSIKKSIVSEKLKNPKITTEELSSIYKVSTTTIRKWINHGMQKEN